MTRWSAGPAVVAIAVYRRTLGRVPRQRRCLFSVTCSRHTEHVARRDGLRAATTAMRCRFRACRPGYSFEFDGDRWGITCVDGSHVGSEELSAAVHAEALTVAGLLGVSVA